MTTFNTGNAVPSADARDRFDNSQTFDEVINGTLTYYANRIGNNVLSLNGMADLFNAAQLERTNEYTADKQARDTEFAQDQAEREAAFGQFLESTDWSSLGAYAAGISIVSHTQTVDYLGQPYSLKPSIPASLDAPYVTTGNWAVEGVNFKLVGDNSLRQDLAADGGAFTIGNNVASVDSIATLLTSPRKTGLVYAVEAYYAGTGVGGNQWKWDALSTAAPDYGSVLQVPGVTTGRFKAIKLTKDYTAYEFGVLASNTGTENRLRLLALGKKLNSFSASATVKMIDEDYPLCMAYPVIFPGYTTLLKGRGRILPVFESVQPPATTAQNPDGTFNCYGAGICFGDPITGKRFSGANQLDMGLIVISGLRIKNVNNLATTTESFLHGVSASGGTIIYADCEIDDMPNTGYYNYLPKAVHYLRCKGRGNGFLGPAFARNGMSNIATHIVDFEWGTHASTSLTVVGCEFSGNKDEGIQYSSFPRTLIRNNNLTRNGDRAIEGDNAYAQASSTRPNDLVEVYENDCRGIPGTTNYSMTFNDGYSKDVYLGGNILGGCRNIPLISTCTINGSINFTSRNKFYLDDTGLVNGCHAMYLNAGLIDLRAGGQILGSHSRSTQGAVMLSANNEIPLGGTLLIGNFTCGVTFVRAVDARTSTKVVSDKVVCPTTRCATRIALVGNASLIEISNADGPLNLSAGSADGLLNFTGLATYTVDKLVLRGNIPDADAATRFPIMVEGTAPAAGRINRLFSSGNYWKGFSYPGGERLASVVGLAVKTSAQDLPVLA